MACVYRYMLALPLLLVLLSEMWKNGYMKMRFTSFSHRKSFFLFFLFLSFFSIRLYNNYNGKLFYAIVSYILLTNFISKTDMRLTHSTQLISIYFINFPPRRM